jgi:hypothetical protein
MSPCTCSVFTVLGDRIFSLVSALGSLDCVRVSRIQKKKHAETALHRDKRGNSIT